MALAGRDAGAVPAVMAHFGRYLGEFYAVRGHEDRLDRITDTIEIGPVRRALGEGRAVLAVTPHFGNWELGALILGRHLGPVSVIIRTTGDEILDRRIRACRGGNRTLDVAQGFRPVLAALNRGGVVCAAIDEPQASGEEIEFLGVRTIVPGALFRAAREANAAVIPTRCRREPSGRLSLECRDETRTAQETADVFSDWIRRDPEQWILMKPIGRAPGGAPS